MGRCHTTCPRATEQWSRWRVDGRSALGTVSRHGDSESAESAFAALVERHGGMVLRVCRGVLGDEQEAQDAFQATFLILARKAGSLWVRGTLGPWLTGSARWTASAARSAGARRKRHERRAAEMAPRVTKAGIGMISRMCSMRRWTGCRIGIARRWCCATSRA